MKWLWPEFSFLSGAGCAGILQISWILGGLSALESQTEMMVQNFVSFFYWKNSKFMGKIGKYMFSMQLMIQQFCSVPQAHWVHLNKCIFRV